MNQEKAKKLYREIEAKKSELAALSRKFIDHKGLPYAVILDKGVPGEEVELTFLYKGAIYTCSFDLSHHGVEDMEIWQDGESITNDEVYRAAEHLAITEFSDRINQQREEYNENWIK